MLGDPQPTHERDAVGPPQHLASRAEERHGPILGRTGAPSARAILVADSAWDALIAAALIASTIAAVMRPLGAGNLKPWPLFALLAAGCLAVSAVMLIASTGPQATAMCRSIAPVNMLTAIAAVALLVAFPHLAHPYILALAVAGIGCALFATLEWTTRPQGTAGRRARETMPDGSQGSAGRRHGVGGTFAGS